MKILIAEDDFTSRRILEILLLQWGYEVVVTSDGIEAWEALQKEDAPPLVILDWMMPGKDGREICTLIKGKNKTEVPQYVILLTSKSFKEDIVNAFDAGADDYITKPFDREELKARIKVGERIVSLQTDLAKQVKELQEALNHIRTLQGILPICSYCKKIRDDRNYWQLLENYISTHSMAQFSHSICPDCYKKYVEPDLEKLLKDTEK